MNSNELPRNKYIFHQTKIFSFIEGFWTESTLKISSKSCINIFSYLHYHSMSNDGRIVDFSKSCPLWRAAASSLMVRSGRPDTQIISTRLNSFVFVVFDRWEPGHPTLILARTQRNFENFRKSRFGHLRHPRLMLLY